ncbi:MAG: HAD-IB family phosphatase [bacterium]
MPKNVDSKLAIFDFDGTITTKDSFNDFLRYRFGWWKFVTSTMTNVFWIILYLMGIVDNRVPKEKILQKLVGKVNKMAWEKETWQYARDRLPDIIKREALERIRWHQKSGHEVVVVSASLGSWIKPWAENNQIKTVLASTLKEKGKYYLPEIATNIFGNHKVSAFKKLYPNYRDRVIYAYGDHRSDEGILSLAQFSYRKIMPRVPNDLCAIVTDGLWRKSLSVIRSLGKANYDVAVLGGTFWTIGHWSRFTTKRMSAPITQIVNLVKQSEVRPVIFPMEDATVSWCSEHRGELAKYADFLLPDKEMLKVAANKGLTMLTARKLGIPTPKTYFPKNPGELISLLNNLAHQQVVIKPIEGNGSKGLVYLKPGIEINWIDHWQKYGKLIVQERIGSGGEAYGVSLLYDQKGKCRAQFSHKRLQQYPNTGGPSTDRISIHYKHLESMSQKLLEHLNWRGVAMVEWKTDPLTHVPHLLEINPRFWGSLELAVRAHVNFPLLYAKAAKGEMLPPAPKYQDGIRCRWLIPGDILRYLTQEAHESLWEFCRGIPKLCEEWDRQDLRGAIATIVCTGVLALNPKYWKYVRRG